MTRFGKKETFPWLPFLLLLGSVFLFWGLPRLLHKPDLAVEFVTPTKK